MFHLPPSSSEKNLVGNSYNGYCVALHLPYDQVSSKGLVKRLKYAFEHGLLFDLNIKNNHSTNYDYYRGFIIRPSLIISNLIQTCRKKNVCQVFMMNMMVVK